MRMANGGLLGGPAPISMDGGELLGARTGFTVTGGHLTPLDFTITRTIQERSSAPELAISVYTYDRERVMTTGRRPVLRYDVQMTFNYLNRQVGGPIAINISDPGIATAYPNGLIKHTGDDGVVAVDVVSPHCEHHFTLQFGHALPAVDSYIAFGLPGSLLQHTLVNLDAALEGKLPSNRNLYALQDHELQLYGRNVDCWAAAYDLSCVSPWNSYAGGQRAGTLVTPKHVACAAHYPIVNGSTIRFITMDEYVHYRTIVSQFSPGGDLQILTLNLALPAAITPAKILPLDWQDYLTEPEGAAILYFDQEEKVHVGRLSTSQGSMTAYDPDWFPLRAAFYEEIIEGDSGNPLIMMINGEPVLLSTFFSPLGGTPISPLQDTINAAIAASGYQLTTVDLTSFTKY